MRVKSTVLGLLAPLCFAASLSACNQNYDDQRGSLANFLKGHQIGSNPDYWLVKRNLGVDDPVVLVFGLLGDLKFCQDLAEPYMSKYRPIHTLARLPTSPKGESEAVLRHLTKQRIQFVPRLGRSLS